MSVLFSVPYALCSTRIFTVFCGTGPGPPPHRFCAVGWRYSCLCSLNFLWTAGALACESLSSSVLWHRLLLENLYAATSNLYSWVIAKTAQNCQTSPKLFCSLQIACSTALQFGFFGNFQFWQLLTLPPSLPVQTPVPPGSRGQRSSPSLSTSLDLHSLHPPCR